ncbi:MAG: hypothetical protein WC878_06440 [Candidatus Paceibacterota bacterium]|jgi:hypothetical protein
MKKYILIFLACLAFSLSAHALECDGTTIKNSSIIGVEDDSQGFYNGLSAVTVIYGNGKEARCTFVEVDPTDHITVHNLPKEATVFYNKVVKIIEANEKEK